MFGATKTSGIDFDKMRDDFLISQIQGLKVEISKLKNPKIVYVLNKGVDSEHLRTIGVYRSMSFAAEAAAKDWKQYEAGPLQFDGTLKLRASDNHHYYEIIPTELGEK